MSVGVHRCFTGCRYYQFVSSEGVREKRENLFKDDETLL